MSNLFGEQEIKNPLLRDKYLEPPFSVIDRKGGAWKKRQKMWKNIGIRSEVGRDVGLWKGTQGFSGDKYGKSGGKKMESESIFDPVLCEICYHWFLSCFKETENEEGDFNLDVNDFEIQKGKRILDPFAGGSVRGIVANYLGYDYTGIDIRPEQVASNYEQSKLIIPDRQPNWIVGDSNKVLDSLILEEYDMLFSCPPYADLEVYSDIKGDISNMSYPEFMMFYRSIIKKAAMLIKPGGFAVWVIGEVRNKKNKRGEYLGFVPDTIDAFREAGMGYYNEGVLLDPIGTAMLRVGTIFEKGNKKLVKTHQNVLVFIK